MVDLESANPLGKFDIGLGAVGNVLIGAVLVVFILGLIAVLIFVKINKKKYKYSIPLYKLIGNTPTRVATFNAKDFPIGKAGDKLWFVAKVKKFIQPAILQSAPNEYMHWEREDGEWINFAMGDLDKDQKQAGVKYIAQDMRAQRIATGNILEQRLVNKSFWDKYKDMITHVIFYLIVMICMVVIFWQWSKIVEQTSSIIGTLDEVLKRLENVEKPQNSIIPVTQSLFPLLFLKFRGKNELV